MRWLGEFIYAESNGSKAQAKMVRQRPRSLMFSICRHVERNASQLKWFRLQPVHPGGAHYMRSSARFMELALYQRFLKSADLADLQYYLDHGNAP